MSVSLDTVSTSRATHRAGHVIKDRAEWDDVECAPEQRANAARDDLPQPYRSLSEGTGPMPTIVAGRRQRNPYRRGEPQTPEATIAHLRELLAEAIATRDELVSRGFDVLPAGDKHWFVNDGEGYCLACSLPWQNARHVERPT